MYIFLPRRKNEQQTDERDSGRRQREGEDRKDGGGTEHGRERKEGEMGDGVLLVAVAQELGQLAVASPQEGHATTLFALHPSYGSRCLPYHPTCVRVSELVCVCVQVAWRMGVGKADARERGGGKRDKEYSLSLQVAETETFRGKQLVVFTCSVVLPCRDAPRYTQMHRVTLPSRHSHIHAKREEERARASERVRECTSARKSQSEQDRDGE